MLKLHIQDEAELEEIETKYRKWDDYNGALIRQVASTEELVRSYYPLRRWVDPLGVMDLSDHVGHLHDDIRTRINQLESIWGYLELIPEEIAETGGTQPATRGTSGNRVFVVHGHDAESKQAVARTIERLGLESVVLQEQPNQGRTIIEKFEDYADVSFAVVLLTEDDQGASINEPHNLQPRARQNVIFELGFFIGKLGRAKVCALHKGNVEILSDFAGVLWVPMDPSGAWRIGLAREMKAAGLNVDLNRLAAI